MVVAVGIGVVLVALGIALAAIPYERSLAGHYDGERVEVVASCPAAIVGVIQRGNSLLDADGSWASDPPCGYRAEWRLGAGVLLAASGVFIAWMAIRREQRRRSGVPPAPVTF